MNVMDQLMSDINRLTNDPTGSLTYYTCGECGATYGSNSGPKTKCECGSEAFQYPGATKEESKSRREAAIAPANPTVESTVATVVVEKPKRRAVKKQEEQQKPATPAVSDKVEPAPDFKAEREAAIAHLISSLNLNEFQPVHVGSALVQAVGYTLWIRDDRGARPVYRVQESFETAADFRAAYDAARAEQPALKIDCAALSHVDNKEVEACLYNGDLIASLNTGHGTLRVKAGQRVKIGAFKTKENRLRFAVIE